MGRGTHSLIFLLLLFFKHASSYETFTISMPSYPAPADERYICTGIKLNDTLPDASISIVGFEPFVTSETVHHVVVFGCQFPGKTDPAWTCGNLGIENATNPFNLACSEALRTQVLFSWAQDAEGLILPENVGFEAGVGSHIQYVVIQVHYHLMDQSRAGQPDSSGMKIQYVLEQRPLKASVLTLFAAGRAIIPPHSIFKRGMVCNMEEQKHIIPVAFGVHTHSLGRMVSGWLVRRDARGIDNWTMIGKRDPQKPQAFVRVANTVTVMPGDLLAVRCLMESDRNTSTTFGSGSNDEMCAFFIVYYVQDGLKPLVNTFCSTRSGRPNTDWELMDFNNIPTDQQLF